MAARRSQSLPRRGALPGSAQLPAGLGFEPASPRGSRGFRRLSMLVPGRRRQRLERGAREASGARRARWRLARGRRPAASGRRAATAAGSRRGRRPGPRGGIGAVQCRRQHCRPRGCARGWRGGQRQKQRPTSPPGQTPGGACSWGSSIGLAGAPLEPAEFGSPPPPAAPGTPVRADDGASARQAGAVPEAPAPRPGLPDRSLRRPEG